MRFKEWIICETSPNSSKEFSDFSHEDQQYEDAMAEYLYKIIEKMLEDFFASGKSEKLSQILAQKGQGKLVNMGSQAVPQYAIRIDVPPVIDGIRLPNRFNPMKLTMYPTDKDSGASYGIGSVNLYINTNTVDRAKSFDDPELQKMLAKMQYQLHHELSHASSAKVNSANTIGQNPYLNKKSARDEKYIKGKIDYFTDRGEMMAHAKQYAVLYNRFFPRESFDLNKMMTLVEHQPWKINLYFKGMTARGEELNSIWGYDVKAYERQIAEASKNFLQMVNFFVNKLIEWRSKANNI